MLVLEGGDALFKKTTLSAHKAEEEKRYAELIPEANDHMGTDVFVPSVRDLAAGLEFLLEQRAARTMTFVSANLVDETTGLPIFEKSLVLTRGGLRLGITGVITADLVKRRGGKEIPGLMVTDPVEAAKEVVAKLKGETDLVLVVAALTGPETKRLTTEAPGIDFVFLSHDQRTFLRRPSAGTTVPHIGALTRGRNVGNLKIFLRKPGEPFADISERQTLEKRISRLSKNLESRKKRNYAEASQAARDRHKRTIERLEKQVADAEERLKKVEGGPNVYSFAMTSLSTAITADPEILAMVRDAKREAVVLRKKAGSAADAPETKDAARSAAPSALPEEYLPLNPLLPRGGKRSVKVLRDGEAAKSPPETGLEP